VLEVSVRAFLDHVAEPLRLEICAGAAGQTRMLRSSRIQKPGLALAGYSDFVQPDRLQVLGQTELSYLETLSMERRDRAITDLVSVGVACFLVTKGLPIPEELIRECEETQTVLLRTPLGSSTAIRKVLTYLDDLLMPRTSVHGVLVDVDGVGTLMTGVSGIGKSECALDLVLRGHRLVADDVVLIEIRGLGILNVAELYGVAATRVHKRIELHVELEEWRQDRDYDRLGIDQRTHDILGVDLPSLLVPLRPGRNAAGIVEVAARNYLLRDRGHNAANELKARIDRELENSLRGEAAAAETTPKPETESSTGPMRRAAGLTAATDHIEDEVE
jgi:HPr kinase/phosphorylase